MSLKDMHLNIEGSRDIFDIKDVSKFDVTRNDTLTKEHCIKLLDVHDHMSPKQWNNMLCSGNPIVTYGWNIEAPVFEQDEFHVKYNGQNWDFITESGLYKHDVWKTPNDLLLGKRYILPSLSYMASVVTVTLLFSWLFTHGWIILAPLAFLTFLRSFEAVIHTVTTRKVGEGDSARVVTLYIPTKRIGLYHYWQYLDTTILPQRTTPEVRIDAKGGGKMYGFKIKERDQMVWRICEAHSDVSHRIEPRTMALIRNASLYNTNKRPTPGIITVNSAKHADVSDKDNGYFQLAICFFTSGEDASNIVYSLPDYNPDPRYYTMRPSDTYEDPDKTRMRSFTKSSFIVDRQYSAEPNRDNVIAAADKRVANVGAKNLSLTPMHAKYAKEFIEQIKRDTGIDIAPFAEPEEVDKRQTRAGQRISTAEARDWLPSVATRQMLKAFLKNEAYADPKDPRIITTIGSEPKYACSLIGYTIADVLKKTRWYGSGKSPRATAEIVAQIINDAELSIIEGDFSRMDGTVTAATRSIDLYLLKAFTDPRYHYFIEQWYDKIHSNTVKGSNGVVWDQYTVQASGDPFTSLLNTFRSALHTFVAYRLMKLSPEDAYARLGIFSGDDGLTPDGDKDKFVKAAELLGWKYKVDIKYRSKLDYCTFLSRIYGPGAWGGDPSNIAEVRRAVAQFPHTTADARIPDWVVAYAKALSYMTSDWNTPIITEWCDAILSSIDQDDYDQFMQGKLVDDNTYMKLVRYHAREFNCPLSSYQQEEDDYDWALAYVDSIGLDMAQVDEWYVKVKDGTDSWETPPIIEAHVAEPVKENIIVDGEFRQGTDPTPAPKLTRTREHDSAQILKDQKEFLPVGKHRRPHKGKGKGEAKGKIPFHLYLPDAVIKHNKATFGKLCSPQQFKEISKLHHQGITRMVSADHPTTVADAGGKSG